MLLTNIASSKNKFTIFCDQYLQNINARIGWIGQRMVCVKSARNSCELLDVPRAIGKFQKPILETIRNRLTKHWPWIGTDRTRSGRQIHEHPSTTYKTYPVYDAITPVDTILTSHRLVRGCNYTVAYPGYFFGEEGVTQIDKIYILFLFSGLDRKSGGYCSCITSTRIYNTYNVLIIQEY